MTSPNKSYRFANLISTGVCLVALTTFVLACGLPLWSRQEVEGVRDPAYNGGLTTFTLERRVGLWLVCLKDTSVGPLPGRGISGIIRDSIECDQVETEDLSTTYGIRYKWRAARVFSGFTVAFTFVLVVCCAFMYTKKIMDPATSKLRAAFWGLSIFIVASGLIATIMWHDIETSSVGANDLRPWFFGASDNVFVRVFRGERDEGSYGASFILNIIGWIFITLNAFVVELVFTNSYNEQKRILEEKAKADKAAKATAAPGAGAGAGAGADGDAGASIVRAGAAPGSGSAGLGVGSSSALASLPGHGHAPTSRNTVTSGSTAGIGAGEGWPCGVGQSNALVSLRFPAGVAYPFVDTLGFVPNAVRSLDLRYFLLGRIMPSYESDKDSVATLPSCVTHSGVAAALRVASGKLYEATVQGAVVPAYKPLQVDDLREHEASRVGHSEQRRRGVKDFARALVATAVYGKGYPATCAARSRGIPRPVLRPSPARVDADTFADAQRYGVGWAGTGYGKDVGAPWTLGVPPSRGSPGGVSVDPFVGNPLLHLVYPVQAPVVRDDGRGVAARPAPGGDLAASLSPDLRRKKAIRTTSMVHGHAAAAPPRLPVYEHGKDPVSLTVNAVASELRWHQDRMVLHFSHTYGPPNVEQRTVYHPPAARATASEASGLRLMFNHLRHGVSAPAGGGAGRGGDNSRRSKRSRPTGASAALLAADPKRRRAGSIHGEASTPSTVAQVGDAAGASAAGASAAVKPNAAGIPVAAPPASVAAAGVPTATAAPALKAAGAIAGPSAAGSAGPSAAAAAGAAAGPAAPSTFAAATAAATAAAAAAAAAGAGASALGRAARHRVAPAAVGGWTPEGEALLAATVAKFGTNWDLVNQVLRGHPAARGQSWSPRQCFERHRKMVHASMPRDELMALARRNRSLGTYTGTAHRGNVPGFAFPLSALGHWRLRASSSVPIVPPKAGQGGLDRSALGWTTSTPGLPTLRPDRASDVDRVKVAVLTASAAIPPELRPRGLPNTSPHPSYLNALTESRVLPMPPAAPSTVVRKLTPDAIRKAYTPIIEPFRRAAPYVMNQRHVRPAPPRHVMTGAVPNAGASSGAAVAATAATAATAVMPATAGGAVARSASGGVGGSTPASGPPQGPVARITIPASVHAAARSAQNSSEYAAAAAAAAKAARGGSRRGGGRAGAGRKLSNGGKSPSLQGTPAVRSAIDYPPSGVSAAAAAAAAAGASAGSVPGASTPAPTTPAGRGTGGKGRGKGKGKGPARHGVAPGSSGTGGASGAGGARP